MQRLFSYGIILSFKFNTMQATEHLVV